MEYLVLGIAGLMIVLGNSAPAQACQAVQKEFRHTQVQSYQPTQTPRGAVIIVPPTGGSNFLDRRYARSLCRAGFESVIITYWQGIDEENLDLAVHERLLRRGQLAISETLEELSSHSFVGILGTSVGAIHGLTALGSTPIDAGFFIAGGAPVSQVIAESSQRELALYRNKRKTEFGFQSTDEYQSALAQAIPQDLEPLYYQDTLRNKSIGFILAKSDDTVPTHLQQQVVDQLNPLTLLKINASHFWAIVKSWWFYEDVIVDFFVSESWSCEEC
jgi:hypothetical protein